MLELLKTRRSIRKFLDKEVEREKIDVIIKSALLSPSSKSIRPWEFIIVTDKQLLDKLLECKKHSAVFLKDAPLGIVVIADNEVSDVWIEDAAIASTIIQLSAQTLGLSSCWIQIRQRLHNDILSAEQYTKEILNIPSNYSVLNIIAVGYPNEVKKQYEENDLQNYKVHNNMF